MKFEEDEEDEEEKKKIEEGKRLIDIGKEKGKKERDMKIGNFEK